MIGIKKAFLFFIPYKTFLSLIFRNKNIIPETTNNITTIIYQKILWKKVLLAAFTHTYTTRRWNVEALRWNLEALNWPFALRVRHWYLTPAMFCYQQCHTCTRSQWYLNNACIVLLARFPLYMYVNVPIYTRITCTRSTDIWITPAMFCYLKNIDTALYGQVFTHMWPMPGMFSYQHPNVDISVVMKFGHIWKHHTWLAKLIANCYSDLLNVKNTSKQRRI